jgi:hypothetical protein
MERRARAAKEELDWALSAVAVAQTPMQLRQYQAVLIPALTGASLEVTAAILGLSRHRVCMLRRQLRSGQHVVETTGKRGGRRRALMSQDEEIRFLEPWMTALRNGGNLTVANIHAAYEQILGVQVPKSTVYRLLARHGWRRRMASDSVSV